MPKKRSSWNQSTLFPYDPDESADLPQPARSAAKGDNDALQDDGPRTSEGADGVARATASDASTSADVGSLRGGTEGQSRRLEENSLPGEAGQRAEPDRQRSPGNGSSGTGGPFALRVASGRNGT